MVFPIIRDKNLAQNQPERLGEGTTPFEGVTPLPSHDDDPPPSVVAPQTRRAIYTLGIDVFFNARHCISVNGQCGAIHPHSFRVNVKIHHTVRPGEQYRLGFAEARSLVQDETARFNDTFLNHVYPFNNGYDLQPTTENLAAVLFQRIRQKLADGLRLESVTIWESPTSYVTYMEEEGE